MFNNDEVNKTVNKAELGLAELPVTDQYQERASSVSQRLGVFLSVHT